ncbi:MAG: DUF2341 domain-containing protein [Deltaproteobacteria bacterium]|nr:DUF2341 domain-containing protein [Deltaproteobacteria bacterium]
MLTTYLFSFILAVTGESWFQFSHPEPAQSGDYEHSQSIVLDNNSAFLGSTNEWHAPGWSFRYTLYVQNDATMVTNFPVRIDLSNLPQQFFDSSNIDGSDIRIFAEDGTPITTVWVEYFNFIEMTGTLWVRIPTIYSTTSVYYIYFGNADAESAGSWQSVFLYPEMNETALWPWAQSDVSLFSFESPIDIQTSDGTLISITDTSSVNQIMGEVALTSNGPFTASSADTGTDTVVPFSYMADEFIYGAVRDSDIFVLYSPTEDATVTVMIGSTTIGEVTVNASTVTLYPLDVSGNYHIVSSVPIVAAHRTDSGNDAHPMVGAANVLWGATTGTTYVSAVNDNTSLTVYLSDGTTQSYTINSDTYTAIESGITNGIDGHAMRLVADGPIGALSIGDGDGGEAVIFLPEKHMSTVFRFPSDGRYALISAKHSGTWCSEITPDGTEIQTLQTTAYAPLFAGHLRMTNLTEGNYLICDGPVWAMYEDASLLDERQLNSIKDFTPVTYPEIISGVVTTGEVSKFEKGPGYVITPEFEVPWTFNGWEEITMYEPSDFPAGTEAGYQISQDGGETWIYYDGASWIEATDNQNHMTGAMLEYSFPDLPLIPRIMMKIILSGDGSITPVQGPIKITYDYDEAADHIVISEIPTPQYQGQAFSVTFEARDENNRLLTGYNKPLALSMNNGTISPNVTPPLSGGKLTLNLATTDTGTGFILYAGDGIVTSASNEFEVYEMAADHILKVAGDQQWGKVGEKLDTDLKIRVLNENSMGVAFREVTFTVSEGSGTLGDENSSEVTLSTDADGYASISFIPSEGANTVTVSSNNLDSVTFVVRGDVFRMSDAEGTNCSISSAGNKNPDSSRILFIFFSMLTATIFRKRIIRR